ncbi:TolB-like translocation protein [Gracilibacillus sp. Marseille-QA3620]
MLREMKWTLAAIVCTLLVAGCSNISSSSQQNDDVYVMMKGNDLYIKYPEKDSEKVASNVLEESASYIDGKGLMFVDDDYSLYLYEDGEKQKIANNVSDKSITYGLSDNSDTIAYLSDEDDLYAIFNGKDKIKVASGISYYKISSDGEHIYYTNEKDDLYCFSSDKQKDKIASEVIYYDISDDGNKIVIYTGGNDLYIRDIEEEDKKKIISDEEIYYYNMIIDNNGDLAYLTDYDDDDKKGELYFKYRNGISHRIASDVSYFHKQDDSFYVLDVDGNLCVKDIGSKKSKRKLAEEVHKFYVVGEQVYYIDGDDNLFSIKNGKKEKIGVDISQGEYNYQVSTLGENIVFLTKDNELYFNAEKISSDVELFVAYVDKIIYRTDDNALHSVSINKLDKKGEFKNPNSYSSIYYGNQLVYNSILSAEDI